MLSVLLAVKPKANFSAWTTNAIKGSGACHLEQFLEEPVSPQVQTVFILTLACFEPHVFIVNEIECEKFLRALLLLRTGS